MRARPPRRLSNANQKYFSLHPYRNPSHFHVLRHVFGFHHTEQRWIRCFSCPFWVANHVWVIVYYGNTVETAKMRQNKFLFFVLTLFHGADKIGPTGRFYIFWTIWHLSHLASASCQGSCTFHFSRNKKILKLLSSQNGPLNIFKKSCFQKHSKGKQFLHEKWFRTRSLTGHNSSHNPNLHLGSIRNKNHYVGWKL